MAIPSVTYTFANSTTANATEVNQNFTDIINSLTDGTKSLTIDALTCAGTATLNGNVTLGNGSVDDITFTGSMASTLPIKTNNSFNIGSATLGLAGVYLGASGGFTTRLVASATSSWTLTLPPAVPAAANARIAVSTAGTASFEATGSRQLVSKTANYTATAADEVILCNVTGGGITITLPAASSNTNKCFTIKKTDSSTNTVTVDGNASETIDGATTYSITIQYESITIVCDGSNWHII